MYFRRLSPALSFPAAKGKAAIVVIDMEAPQKTKSVFEKFHLSGFYYLYDNKFRHERVIRNILRVINKTSFPTYVFHEAESKFPSPNIPPDERILAAANCQGEPLHKASHNAFAEATFVNMLKENGISSVIICGYDRAYCVHDSIKGAIDNGFQVFTSEKLMFGRGITKDGIHAVK